MHQTSLKRFKKFKKKLLQVYVFSSEFLICGLFVKEASMFVDLL